MAEIQHVFVYGTLLPGDVRWHRLRPYVVDDGWTDSVDGQLFDTGLDYPAARFHPPGSGRGLIVGRTMPLLEASRERALAHLDDIEGTVAGLYHRVPVTTHRGHRAWSYQYGGELELVPIESGDWLAHRPL